MKVAFKLPIKWGFFCQTNFGPYFSKMAAWAQQVENGTFNMLNSLISKGSNPLPTVFLDNIPRNRNSLTWDGGALWWIVFFFSFWNKRQVPVAGISLEMCILDWDSYVPAPLIEFIFCKEGVVWFDGFSLKAWVS